MDHGKVVVSGKVEDVIRGYDDQNSRNAMNSAAQFQRAASAPAASDAEAAALPAEYGHQRGGTGDAVCTAVRVLGPDGQTGTDSVPFGGTMFIEYRYSVTRRIEKPIFRSSIDAAHYKFIVSLDSVEQGFVPEYIEPGEYVMRVRIDDMKLRPGKYSINTSITARNLGLHIFYWLSAASFVVAHTSELFLYSNDKAVVFFPCRFDLEQLS